MILGFSKEERVFNASGFLKSKVRNKLDKNLENFLRLYTSRYEVNDFPYKRALQLWRKKCQRGLDKFSNNEITNLTSGIDIGSIDVGAND